MRNKKLFAVIIGLSLFSALAGCDRSPAPLTSQELRVIGNSKIIVAYLDFEDGTQYRFERQEFATAKSILRCLSPIDSFREGELDNAQVTLTYQSGHSPTSIKFKTSEEKLEFSLGKFTYVCKYKNKFVRLVEDVRKRGQKTGK